MPRIGTNPARKKTQSFAPAKITAAVMVYIPEQKGYFSQRLDIFKLCLKSLRENTSIPLDTLVLANGCSNDVVSVLRELQEDGKIDTLIVSRQNLGVIGGYKQIFTAAQGEIVAYCDDDIVFYPNWLEEQLKILETFPKAGMVSGVPVRDGAQHATTALQKYMRQKPENVRFQKERQIPDEWEIDWCESTGRDYDIYMKETASWVDTVLAKNNVEAIGGANHFQFVAPKMVIQKALPETWSPNLMDSLVPLEESVDRMGYLRLSTVGRYCRHIGNVLPKDLVSEASGKVIVTRESPKTKKHWLLKIPGAGRLLWRIYDWLFKILNQVDS